KVDMDGAAPFAQFENPNIPAEHGAARAAELIEAALSLDAGAIDRGSHKPRRVGAGIDFIYVKAPMEAVRRAKIDSAAWAKLGLDKIVGVLIYAEGGEAKDATYHVRMFAPDAGVFEDPATGSAACALPGQIALAQMLADGPHCWVVEQGFEMGRPSRIHVEFEAKSGAPGKVRIGGNAIAVTKGQIFV
ncbi:MAG: PhzF family phenazine biosynthesis protein, partial [Parvularculaceae bacterium]